MRTRNHCGGGRRTRNGGRPLRSALLLAVALCDLVVAPAVAAQELLANGDFEAGALGWTATDAFVNTPFGAPTSISGATTGPLSGLPVPGPNAGTAYALFDASGPSTQALVQVFTVPPGTKSVEVRFALAVGDWSGVGSVDAGGLDHALSVNQHFRVDVLTAGASAFDTGPAVVANLFLAVGTPPASHANQLHDLTNVVLPGTTYQLRFASVHNQGYLTAGVDDVSVFASPALCGDGIPDAGEDCDDAGESATCDADCTFVVCGDGTPNAAASESCDDGDGVDANDCTNACALPTCGDGIAWNQGTGAEQCDDGDSIHGNDCTNACKIALCGDGIPWFSGSGTEECDDANANDNDNCTSVCETAKCGDGIRWHLGLGTEACDDGDAIDENDCTNACALPSCGDGIHWNQGAAAEACDDGDGVDHDDCTNACTLAVCGDGVVFNLGAGTERCDDGGTADGDGCSSTCEPEPSLLPLLQRPMGWALALLLTMVAAAFLRREHATGSRRARAARSTLLACVLAQLSPGVAHAADFAIQVVEDVLDVCPPDYGSVTVDVTTTGESAVTLSVPSAPAGLVRHATPTTLTSLPGSSVLALGATNVPALGSSVVTVVGTGASGVAADAFTLNLLPAAPAPPALLAPTDGAPDVAIAPTLTWSATAYASSFAVEVASDASFSSVVHSAVVTTNSETVPALAPAATYYWRVRSENSCGAGAFSPVSSFTTTATVCDTYASTDVPKAIPTLGTVTSTLIVAGGQAAVTDVNVTFFGTHARVGDLVVSLESPEATSLAIADFSSCANDSDFDLSLDDAALQPIPCPPTDGSAHLPTNPLAAYALEDPNGTWTLSVADQVAGSGGTLEGFSVEICAGPSLPALATVASIDRTQLQNQTVVVAIDIENVGSGDLVWNIDLADDAGFPSFGRALGAAPGPAVGPALPPSDGAFARGVHAPSLGRPPQSRGTRSAGAAQPGGAQSGTGSGSVSAGAIPGSLAANVPASAGVFPTVGSGLVYATETQTDAFTSFALGTPGTINTIAPFADEAFAGDFAMDGTLYLVNHTTGNLERVTTAGARTVVGPSAALSGHAFTGLALDPTTGTMYASSASCGVSSALYALDLATGAAALVGAVTNAPCLISLAIDDAGRAWGHDVVTDRLVRIDLASGAGTVVGAIGFDANFGQGMDYDSASGELYISAFNNGTTRAELRIVDTATGATTLVGQLGPAVRQFGWMAVDNPLPPPPRLAYSVDLTAQTFIRYGIATPGAVNTIDAFAEFSAAGDFWDADTIYLINDDTNELERVTTAGARTTVGATAPIAGHSFTGLATDPTTGTVYASSAECGVASALYTIDLTSGTATLVGGVTNSTCLIAIAIDDLGQAFGYDVATDELLRVDLSNGAGTVVGSIGFDANFAQGLDWDANSGQLYMAAFNDATTAGELRIVDTTTGNTTLVGAIGQGVANPGFIAIAAPTAASSSCASLGDTPWLSVTPTGGVTPHGGTSPVEVTLDSSGLPLGTYESALCIASNDATQPLVAVPVTMTVSDAVPIIDLAPTALTSAQPTDTVVVETLDVGNIGTVDLTWTLDEQPAASLAAARAAAVSPQTEAAIESLAADAGGEVRLARGRDSGAARFVGFERARPLALAGATRRSKARSFLARHGRSFGVRDAANELVEISDRRDRRGFAHVAFEQRYGGLPVFGGGLRLHFDPSDRLSAANGRVIEDISVDPNPRIDASDATRIAKQIVLAQPTSDGSAKRRPRQPLHPSDLVVNDVELMVFRAGLLQHEVGRVHLAYRVEVRSGAGLREIVFVDAHRGTLVERHTGVHEALFRRLYETNLSNQIWVEGAPFPGTLDVWQQTEVVTAAHAYRFFDNAFGHTSYDDADAQMRTINNDPTILCPNANWNGVTANYCTGTAADDVVAHEWGHAYTEYTSGLIYAWQTGALNESHSDIWGETIDLINGYRDAGEDLSARAACGDTQRWMMGEDATAFGGALRDMWNPNCNGDPAKVSDGQYWCTSADFGGVHTNSGVPNRLYSLLVDGGTFNGQSITALGFTKAAHLHFRAQSVYETNTSDFEDHADALEQACSDLIGVNLETLTTGSPAGPSGQVLTTTDCDEVAEAILAVELRTPSCPGVFTPMLAPNAPPLCAGGTVDSILLADFEAGFGGFTVGQLPMNPVTWDAREFAVVGALPDGRPGSAAYGIDPVVGNCQADLDNGVIYLQSPPIPVPGGATAPILLAFDHYASLEQDWDGGNLKYSTNGTTWNVVPSSAFTFNAYNGTLNTAGAGNDNPMAGQPAFTGANDGTISGSWGQSQVDLSVVGVGPGDTVHLRFELGTDGCNGWDGWYVDDVEVYGCSIACSNPSDVPWLSATPTAGVTSPSGATSVDVTFDSTGLAEGSYAASLCVSSNDPVRPVVALPVTLDVATP